MQIIYNAYRLIPISFFILASNSFTKYEELKIVF